MKGLKYFSLLLILILPGCFTDSSVNPDFGSNSGNAAKSWIISSTSGTILEKEYVVSQLVDGRTGGNIYYGFDLANLSVIGSLTVPKSAFDGVLEISAAFNNQTTTQSFTPSVDFRKPLLLTLEYRGVNLNNVNPADVDFYYIGDDGQFYKAEYSSLVVDPSAGVLKVVNVKIDHFSRYGWAK